MRKLIHLFLITFIHHFICIICTRVAKWFVRYECIITAIAAAVAPHIIIIIICTVIITILIIVVIVGSQKSN